MKSLLSVEFNKNLELNLNELATYLKGTYGEHYAEDIQAIDTWNTMGSASTTCRDTAIKYLMRYGKKDGKNRKDLLKAIHYVMLMLEADRPPPKS